jgi:rubrerythrin
MTTVDDTRTDDPINIVTFLTGATVKPGPMVSAVPDLIVQDDDLAGFAAGSGLNSPFVADLLGAAIAHERDGVNLFRMLAATSNNPVLIKKFGDLAQEAMQASKVWAELIVGLGGNPNYVSPPGRMTETMDAKIVESFLGAGSADPLTLEMAGVQATLAAATLCVAFVDALTTLADEADGQAADKMRDAATVLIPTAADHVAWAGKQLNTMVVTFGKHGMAQKVGQAAEKMVGKVKDALS